MVTRYTEKDARRCGGLLAKKLGKDFGDCAAKVDGRVKFKVGCWNVDYAGIYGGAVIEEISNEGGGVTRPLGEGRLKPYEFCRATRMA